MQSIYLLFIIYKYVCVCCIAKQAYLKLNFIVPECNKKLNFISNNLITIVTKKH